MPDRDWPPIPRRVAHAARAVMYALVPVAGVAVLADIAPIGGLAQTWAATMSVIGIIAGTVGTISVLRSRWHPEWVATWFVAMALLGYSALEWPDDIATGAILTAAAHAAIARGIDLWVFSLTANRVKRRRHRRLGVMP